MSGVQVLQGALKKKNIARSNNVTAETAENVNYFGYNFFKM
jgi:hypothetical protein